jgi:uncharacterized metal-binding protein
VTIWRMRISRWVPTVANTHSEYVVLIDLPLQQWLYDRSSMLRYTYLACLLYFSYRSAAHTYLDVHVKETACIIVCTCILCILITIEVFSPTDAQLDSLKTNFNPLNAELNPICHLLVLLGDLTFADPCIVSIFQYTCISNKKQRYTVYLYLETCRAVSRYK